MDIKDIKKYAPTSATHYRLTKLNNPRYLKKDESGDWLVYQDWVDLTHTPNQWRKDVYGANKEIFVL